MAGGEGADASAAASAEAPGAGAGPRASGNAEPGAASAAEAATVADGGVAAAAAVDPAYYARLACLTNAYYHGAREASLDWLHRALMFAVVVFSAAAWAKINVFHWLERGWAELIVVVAGTLDLVFNLSERARAHGYAMRRYTELLADIEAGHPIGEITADLIRIGGDEEPPFHGLLWASHNRAITALGGNPGDRILIGPWCRLQMNWRRFEGKAFETLVARKQRLDERRTARKMSPGKRGDFWRWYYGDQP